jgi:hypothetical protein
MRKTIVALAVAALTTASMAAGTTGVGEATTQVFSCHLGYSSTAAWAWCDLGAGGVRVTGYCWNGSFDERFYGPWRPAGQLSSFSCAGGDGGKVLDGAWYETF